MGNIVSCAPSIIYSAVVKVVFIVDGRLRVYTKPMKAGDLLADNPGSFLCDSSDLKVGHRIPGLIAGEQLIPRRTYFLLPMELLYSVLTIEEMDFLTEKASKLGGMNLSKVFVDFNCWFPTSGSEKRFMDYGGKEEYVDLVNGFSCSRQRSWSPSLETILEIPIPTPTHD